MSRPRLKHCTEQWPECTDGEYNPSCCRFPKSCSCTIYNDDTPPDELEDATADAPAADAPAQPCLDLEERIARLIDPHIPWDEPGDKTGYRWLDWELCGGNRAASRARRPHRP